MNKQAVCSIALVIACYGYAEERESVNITITIKVDKDLVDQLLEEAKSDIKALEEKYEVCGIEDVQATITRNTVKEVSVKSCGCSCNCSKCSNGSCCKCKSTNSINEDFCTCSSKAELCVDCGKPTEEVRCSCGKPKQKEEEIDRCACGKPKQKSIRAINDDEFCHCQIVQEKCPGCGKITEEFRCNCGKPRPKDAEVDRCACGKPTKPRDEQQ